jgi:hypothetical protein
MSDAGRDIKQDAGTSFGSTSQISDVVAGSALGLFIGALVGLSLTPGITSTVVTALVAVLAIFFGLTDATATTKLRPATGRMAAFCIAALFATTVGIYARTHNLLSPPGGPLSDLAAELKSLGYSDDEVHTMIKTKYFGSNGEAQPIPPEDLRRVTGSEMTRPKPAQQ